MASSLDKILASEQAIEIKVLLVKRTVAAVEKKGLFKQTKTIATFFETSISWSLFLPSETKEKEKELEVLKTKDCYRLCGQEVVRFLSDCQDSKDLFLGMITSDQIGAIFNRGAKKSFLCASLAIDFISFLLDLRKSKEREQENVCNKLKDSLGVLVRTKSWSDAASVPKISLQVSLLRLFVNHPESVPGGCDVIELVMRRFSSFHFDKEEKERENRAFLFFQFLELTFKLLSLNCLSFLPCSSTFPPSSNLDSFTLFPTNSMNGVEEVRVAVQVLSILLSTEREISQSFSLFFSMLVPSVQQKIIRNLTKSGTKFSSEGNVCYLLNLISSWPLFILSPSPDQISEEHKIDQEVGGVQDSAKEGIENTEKQTVSEQNGLLYALLTGLLKNSRFEVVEKVAMKIIVSATLQLLFPSLRKGALKILEVLLHQIRSVYLFVSLAPLFGSVLRFLYHEGKEKIISGLNPFCVCHATSLLSKREWSGIGDWFEETLSLPLFSQSEGVMTMKEFLFASSMKSEITSAPFFVELGYLQTLEKFGSILFPLIGHYTSSSHSNVANLNHILVSEIGLTDLKSDLISFEKSSIRLPDLVGGIESFLQQPDSSSFEKNSGNVGISNIGNTCFFNSVMQILHRTSPVRHAILYYDYFSSPPSQLSPNCLSSLSPQHELENPYAPERTPQTQTDFKKNSEETERSFLLMRAIQQLFGRLSFSLKRSVIPPTPLIRAMPSHFVSFHQQDAGEYIKYFLDYCDTLAKSSSKNKQFQSLVSPFEGTQLMRVKCQECHSVRLKEEKFNDIAVPLFEGVSLQDLLLRFFEPEVLTGENQYFCEKCDRNVDAERDTLLSDSPPIMMLTLLRFAYRGGERMKDFTRIRIPKILTIPVVQRPPNLTPTEESQSLSSWKIVEEHYILYGIVMHVGTTPHSGHYYAFGCNSSSATSEEGSWKCYNDSSVYSHPFELTQKTILTSKSDTPYLLFYSRFRGDHLTNEEAQSTETEATDQKKSKEREKFLKDERNEKIFCLPDRLRMEIEKENKGHLKQMIPDFPKRNQKPDRDFGGGGGGGNGFGGNGPHLNSPFGRGGFGGPGPIC